MGREDCRVLRARGRGGILGVGSRDFLSLSSSIKLRSSTSCDADFRRKGMRTKKRGGEWVQKLKGGTQGTRRTSSLEGKNQGSQRGRGTPKGRSSPVCQRMTRLRSPEYAELSRDQKGEKKKGGNKASEGDEKGLFRGGSPIAL